MAEVLLDVRDLEPPEPLERALEALTTLPRGALLRMVHRREPHLLYPVLRREGFDYSVTPTDDGDFNILIWRD